MKVLRVAAVLIGLGTISSVAHAQDGFFYKWENRVRSTLAEQPPWPVPLFAPQFQPHATISLRCCSSNHACPNRHLELRLQQGFLPIPWYSTEVDINIPPYIQHNSSARDGFGDFGAVLKYRLSAGNQEHGNYSIAASLPITFPTGSYQNGANLATFGPTLHAGKGYKNFHVVTSTGATLPTADGDSIGRPVLWNVVGQYRIRKIFWPEIENNATFFHGGPNDGRVQNLVSPGLVVSSLKLNSDP